MEKIELMVQGVNQNVRTQVLESMKEFYNALQKVKDDFMAIEVTDVNDVDGMAYAKDKLKIATKIRTGTEKKRKEMKRDIIDTGRLMDNVAKSITNDVLVIEEHLKKQANFAQIKEDERLDKLEAERKAELKKYIEHTDLYDVRNMNVIQYEQTLKGVIFQYEAYEQRRLETEAEAKREAEREAAAEREAEERRLQLEAENEALRKKAAELEAKREAEREAYRKEIASVETSRAKTGTYATNGTSPVKTANFASESDAVIAWINSWKLPEMETEDMSEIFQYKIAEIFAKFHKMKNWAKEQINN